MKWRREVRIFKGVVMADRNYRTVNVKDATDQELVFELLKRNVIHDAPVKVENCCPTSMVTIGIGPDHTVDIMIHDDDLYVLGSMVSERNPGLIDTWPTILRWHHE